MNWIKKNPAQLSLAIAALVVMAVAFLLYSNANGFETKFQDAYRNPPEDNKIPPTDLQVLADRTASLDKPAAWTSKKSSLFVSRKYLLTADGLVDPFRGKVALHPPVPNEFIIKYGFDITSPTTLTDDVDKDGFNLLFEYAGNNGVQSTVPPELEADSTDPTKAESHPPYHTRLYLVRIHKVQFRLLFRAYDYNATTKACTIQINPLDRGGRTVFVELGQAVPNTDWKFESFELKDKEDKDLSIANMTNAKTGQKLALVLNAIGDSPESFAVFSYRWVAHGGEPTKDFFKRKDETFILDPEKEKTYKVIDIQTDRVEVLMPSSEKKLFLIIPEPPSVPPIAAAK